MRGRVWYRRDPADREGDVLLWFEDPDTQSLIGVSETCGLVRSAGVWQPIGHFVAVWEEL